MNKYQESFEHLCKHTEFLQEMYVDENKFNKENYLKDKQIIKELVDKETPKKIDMIRYKKYDGYDIGICKCGAIIDISLNDDEINYCHKCGQKLDWSE